MKYRILCLETGEYLCYYRILRGLHGNFIEEYEFPSRSYNNSYSYKYIGSFEHKWRANSVLTGYVHRRCNERHIHWSKVFLDSYEIVPELIL